MATHTGHPTLKDGVPPLTERQQARLNEWLSEIKSHPEMHLPGAHALSWRVEDEHRPGRGHDVEAVAMDGEHLAWLSMDVYGNGSDGYGTLVVGHNGADDECSCNDCEDFRSED